MIDKQKQIEEMKDIIFNSRYKNDYISPLKGANELYNAGYRKIDKDSVVLNQEEWKILHEDYAKALYEKEKKASKEMAKKILKYLLNFIENDTFHIGYELDKVDQKLNELAKQFGVEIKDNEN